MDILVKFPTRSRPNKFLETLSKYQHTRLTNNVHFLVTIDEDDTAMLNPDKMEIMKRWGNLSYEVIKPAGKIGAINHGISEFLSKNPSYQIILLASDDMIPTRNGWDKRIIDEMKNHFPDTDGVLWFNDGQQGNILNTLSIMGKRYYDRFGYIYHPSYQALWCDNEFMDVANQLGKQVYFSDIIIRHDHPIYRQGIGMDYMNARDNALLLIDKQNYEQRKRNQFGINNQRTVTVDIDTDIDGPEIDVRKPVERVKPANRRGRPRKQS